MTKATGKGRSTPWAIALVIAALVAMAAALWGGFQYRRADELAASLSASEGQLEQLRNQVGQLQQQAQEAVVQLELAREPLLPVTVKFRRGPAGEGMTADFRSTAPSQLEVAVSITDPATQRQKRFELVLRPLQSHPSPPGWTFQPGQQLELSSEGFRELDVVASAP